MITTKWLYALIPLAVLAIGYAVGPHPEKPVYDKSLPAVPTDPDALEQHIFQNESRHRLKPGNEAQIVWADSSRRKTSYSVVYLHGFSASQEEGNPVHRVFASTYGCNLFLARLADHGIDTTEQLLLFTPDRVWRSAREALAIGRALGDSVVLISTSTGGTLALMLAAAYPEQVHALVNLSPNIAIRNPLAFLANNPWGNQLGQLVVGGQYQVINYPAERQPFWNGKYRIEAIAQLQELLETSMTRETFQRVSCPTLTLYYYKNEQEQDPTVRVSAMLEMHRQLATPPEKKWERAIPTAGNHVIGSALVSGDLPAVNAAIHEFAVRVLRMTPH